MKETDPYWKDDYDTCFNCGWEEMTREPDPNPPNQHRRHQRKKTPMKQLQEQA